jgi:hypothetical protein
MTKKCTPTLRNVNLFPRVILITLLALFAPALFAQTDNSTESTVSSPETSNKQKPAIVAPAVSDLRGISIGMAADEVRNKLGKPDTGDDAGMYYTFDNGESMQLALDPNKKVSMIAEMYSGKDAKAPELQEIFGSDNSVQPTAEGKVYKMIRYPDAGFWITYSRLNLQAGPLTTITIKKMN